MFSALTAIILMPYFILGWCSARALRRPGRQLCGDTLAFALAWMVFIPVLLSRVNLNFSQLFFASSLLAIVAAIVAWVIQRKRAPESDSFCSAKFSRSIFIFVVLTAIWVGWVGWRISIHDETSIQSHPAVIERILSTGLPPGLISFPQIPLKYHYGFNVAAAQFAYAFHLPGWMAIDVLSILLWVAALLAADNVLAGFGLASRYRIVALAWILLGGAWLWIVAPGVWQHGYLDGRHMKPMQLSLFFQHPVALALPLFFTAMDCWREFRQSGRRRFAVAFAFLTGVTSLAQVVLFGGALLGAGIDVAWAWVRARFRQWQLMFQFLFCAVAVMVVAFLCRGFFETSPYYQSGLTRFTWPPGFLHNEYFAGSKAVSLGRGLLWYLLNLGAPLLLFPFALGIAVSRRIAGLLPWVGIALAGFLIPQFLQYSLSWDVMKFFMLFDLSARLITAVILLPLLNRSVLRWAAALIIVASSLVDPVDFLFRLSVKSYSELPRRAQALIGIPHRGTVERYRELWALLSGQAQDGRYVLANKDLSTWIAVYTGRAVLEFDRNTAAFGVLPNILSARSLALSETWQNPNVANLRAAKVSWVIWTCSEWDRSADILRQALQPGLDEGSLRLHMLEAPGKACLRAVEVLR